MSVVLKKLTFIAVSIFCSLPAVLPACEVPVFRYALERWPAAPYILTAFTGGSLSSHETQAAERCRELFSTQELTANLSFQADSSETDGANRLTISYQRTRDHLARIWWGPLTELNVSRVAQSPAREEIAGRLLDGEAVVWVLLECGDTERDRNAAILLEQELATLQKTLTLPEAVSADQLRDLPELKINFSLIKVSRDDPEEQVLVRMLTSTEAGLDDYSGQPMAFPVFGRGRVLHALVGQGINAQNIYEASAFLTGPCACEIKDLTPGMDLLISANWQSALEHSWVNAVDPLPLSGLGAIAGRDASSTDSRRGISVPLLAMLAAVAAVLAVVVVVSIRIVRSGKAK